MEYTDYLEDVQSDHVGALPGLGRKGKAPSLAKTSIARWNQTSQATP